MKYRYILSRRPRGGSRETQGKGQNEYRILINDDIVPQVLFQPVVNKVYFNGFANNSMVT